MSGGNGMNDPEFELREIVSCPEGTKMVVGRCWENWLWNGKKPTETWVYWLQTVRKDDKNNWERSGHVNRWPSKDISKRR